MKTQYARGTSPYVFKQQRKREGAFRCQICDALYPKSFMTSMDGYDQICSITCKRSMGLQEIAAAHADAVLEATSGASQFEERPVRSNLKGQSLFYSITGGEPLSLPAGLGFTLSIGVTINGLNLSGVTFWTDHPTITIRVISVSADGTSANADVLVPPGAVAGDYNLYSSIRNQGPIRKGYFKVR